MAGTPCHRQKSSVNLPGSPGALATSASGPGLARTASMAAAAAATSPGSRAERTQTTPSRANASASSAAPGIGSIALGAPGPARAAAPPPLLSAVAYLVILSARSAGRAVSLRRAVVAERVGTQEDQQPGVCRKQGVGRTGLDSFQLPQLLSHVGNHSGHPGDQGTGVGEALEVTVGAVDDLATHQQVGQFLRAAETDLEQVTPAAADPPQPRAGPVPGEDGLP